jgi:hypothetical protein
MDAIEQENAELRKEVTTIKADLGRLNALVDSLVAAQNQPPPPPPPQTTVTIEHVAPVSVAPICTPQYTMLEGYPWGMPLHYNRGYQSNVSEISIYCTKHDWYFPTRDDHSSSYSNYSPTYSDYPHPCVERTHLPC